MMIENILWIFFNLLCPFCILLCVIICNVFFIIFRTYQNSLPFPHPQYLIINHLFSHLSITWQAANIFSAIIILTELCFHLESPYFSCVLYYCRQLQIYSTAMCIVFISLARFFANFWTNQYFDLPHQKIRKFCKWMPIVISVFSTFAMARVCNTGTTCPGDRKCMDNGVKMFINICIMPVSFLNLAIVLELLHPKLNSWFQFLKNFKITCPKMTNNTITPVTETMELPTISHTIDSTIQHHVVISDSSNHNVTFTTGLITMMIATMGAGLVIKATNIFGLPFYTSAILPCYGLINTTFISIYWMMANKELKEFAYRVFCKILRRMYQNN
jgi:hypothetical protein